MAEKGDSPEPTLKKKSESPGPLIQVMPHMAFVGVHLFAHWLDQQHTFEPVVAQLQPAVETYKHRHPDEDFVLLHHRDPTLRLRFQALFFATLLGTERFTGFVTDCNPLE